VVSYNTSLDSWSYWGEIKHGAPQGLLLGPLLFLNYNNELSKMSNDNCKTILFADKTSIIVTKPTHIKNCVIKIFQDVYTWFSTNLLSLNIDKIQFMQFVTNILVGYCGIVE